MIYTSSSFQWDHLNEQIKSIFKMPEGQKAYAFRGLSHGLFEMTHALAQFLPHKKKIVFIKGNSPTIPVVLPRFYKLAFAVTVISLSEITDFENLKKSIPDDALFVVFAHDHAVTGEIFKFADELDHYLTEKKIISVQIKHHQMEFKASSPFSAYLISKSDTFAFALAGERIKLLNLLAPELDWENFEKKIELLQKKLNIEKNKKTSLDEKTILEFEQQVQSFALPLLDQNNKYRLWDRSLILLKNANGDTFCHELAQSLKLSSEEMKEKLTTTQVCHRPQMKPWKTWWDSILSEEDLGQLTIIHIDLLKTPNFIQHCQQAYDQALKLAQW